MSKISLNETQIFVLKNAKKKSQEPLKNEKSDFSLVFFQPFTKDHANFKMASNFDLIQQLIHSLKDQNHLTVSN